jgi:hypothetical protein
VERRRTAEANIFLLTEDTALTRSVETLRDAGRAMHHAVGTDAFEATAELHQRELESFAAAARKALRGRRVL